MGRIAVGPARGHTCPSPALRDLRRPMLTDVGGVPRRLAIMFTDIVGSTDLVLTLGDEAWLTLLRWHNAVLRSCFVTHGGREVNELGDGFLAVFECPIAALHCALKIQEQLAVGREHHRCGIHVRIGVQWVDVLETSDDNYVGRGVHETERIKEQAGSDEVLVGLAALEAAGNGFPRSDVRYVSLRGFPEPVELVSLRGGSRVVSADVTADQ